MNWTHEQKLDYLLHLPWTIEAATEDESLVLRVKELPSVIATGQTDKEAEADFWESLKAALESYLHFGDPLPLPKEATQLPWDRPLRQSGRFRVKEGRIEASRVPLHIEAVQPTETRLRFQVTDPMKVPA